MRLKHSDYRRFNVAVAEMYRIAFKEGPYAAVAVVLGSAVGGAANAAALRGGQILACALSEPEMERPMVAMTPLIMRHHPRFGAAARPGHVLGVSDFLSRAAWHGNELHQAARPYFRVEDDLGVRLPLQNGGTFCACVLRDARTFRAEERTIFSLLLPHISNLLNPPAGPGDPSRLSSLGLTPREQEVLHWTSEGKRNSDIAGILGISRGTVKRHLENIYQKLGVENRHGAARRALEKLRPFG
jgi:DNA-binding CsgD family transcriptional regulator